MTYYAEPGKLIYDEWFDENINPLDLMPKKKEHEKDAEKIVTIHEKMYMMARAKYNPFAVGGSEQLGGGSEIFHEKA